MYAQFRRARDDARAAERRGTAVLRSTTDAILELDRDWRVTFANDRVLAMTPPGTTLVGRNLRDIAPELVGTPAWEAAGAVMACQRPAEIEVRSPRSGRWYFVRVFPSDAGLSVYFQDITERKRMEDRLRRSEEHLRMALRSARAGTFEMDLQTGAMQWSEETFRLLGLDPACDQARAETWLGILHPDDRETFLGQRDAVIAGTSADFAVEYRIVRPDGAVRWIAARGRRLAGADGTPERLSGITVDITDQKCAEDALRASEERFRALIHHAPQMMWVNRADGTLEYFNDAWRAYTGHTSTEATRWDLIHPDDQERIKALRRDSIAAGTAYEYEMRLRRADGAYRWHYGRVNPMHQDGAIVAWIGLTRP